MARGNQPELTTSILQKQVLGMRTSNLIMQFCVRFDGKYGLMLLDRRSDPEIGKDIKHGVFTRQLCHVI